MSQPLTNLSPGEITALFQAWGEGEVRAKRLNRYLFRQGVRSFDEMPEMRGDLRERLEREFTLPRLRLHRHEISEDGTQKFVFELSDGEQIESVLIPDVGVKAGTRALCISTQAGCAMGCTFCFTGLGGFRRNLETWEIVDQVREVAARTDRTISHVVYMGMGEPLQNYENVRRSIDTLTEHQGYSLCRRKITVSTVGLLPQMMELAKLRDVQIALSLHAPTDALREIIVPATRRHGVDELLGWMRGFPAREQTRFMVEYILLDGLNNLPEHAAQLAQAMSGIRCKLNLIPYNDVPGLSYRRPSDESTRRFRDILRAARLEVSVRRSRGRDILGACGQLSGRRSEANSVA